MYPSPSGHHASTAEQQSEPQGHQQTEPQGHQQREPQGTPPPQRDLQSVATPAWLREAASILPSSLAISHQPPLQSQVGDNAASILLPSSLAISQPPLQSPVGDLSASSLLSSACRAISDWEMRPPSLLSSPRRGDAAAVDDAAIDTAAIDGTDGGDKSAFPTHSHAAGDVKGDVKGEVKGEVHRGEKSVDGPPSEILAEAHGGRSQGRPARPVVNDASGGSAPTDEPRSHGGAPSAEPPANPDPNPDPKPNPEPPALVPRCSGSWGGGALAGGTLGGGALGDLRQRYAQARKSQYHPPYPRQAGATFVAPTLAAPPPPMVSPAAESESETGAAPEEFVGLESELESTSPSDGSSAWLMSDDLHSDLHRAEAGMGSPGLPPV